MKVNIKYRFLTDDEIISFNDKISGSEYIVKPYYGETNSVSNLLILKDKHPASYYSGHVQEVSTDVHLDFKFVFSVSSNRKEQFFEILDKIKSRKMLSKLYYQNSNNHTQEFPIELDEDIINKKEEEHIILGRNFTRYTYNFSGKLTSIISYVSCLTEVIHYFEKIWGYDEDGKEHCLLQYPIGSIVSKPEDKSKDYLVLEYEFERTTDNKHNIYYVCCEMINADSSVIQYGKTFTTTADKLCFSRNNRIDDILKQ